MTQPYRDASPTLTAETEDERANRHLTEDLQAIPVMYHDVIRCLIAKAVNYAGHRSAKATLDFAMSLSRDAALTASALTKGPAK